MNGASGHTEPTVVTSSILMNVEGLRLLQGPRAAISAIALLFVPGARPGFPPVATIYVCAFVGKGWPLADVRQL